MKVLQWAIDRWLMQGLLTSILTGVGFLVISFTIEYVKRIRKERQAKEQEIFLQRLLYGEQVLEWSNGTVRTRGKRKCLIGNKRSTPRGHLLFEHYKQTGGFLGVGQGYYSRLNEARRRVVENLQDRSTAAAISRASWCGGPSSQTAKSTTSVDDEVTSLEWDTGLSGTKAINQLLSPTSCSGISELGPKEFSGSVSNNAATNNSDIRLWSTPAKDNRVKEAPTELGTNLCHRAVKEHPHLAPFLRRDALKAAHAVEKEGTKCEQKKQRRALYRSREKVAKRSESSRPRGKQEDHEVKASASIQNLETVCTDDNKIGAKNESLDNLHRATNNKKKTKKREMGHQQMPIANCSKTKTGQKEETGNICPLTVETVALLQKSLSKGEKSSSTKCKNKVAAKYEKSSIVKPTKSEISSRRSSPQHPHQRPFNSTSLQNLPKYSFSRRSVRSNNLAGTSKSQTTGMVGRRRRSRSGSPTPKAKGQKKLRSKIDYHKPQELNVATDCGRTRSASTLIQKINHGFEVKQMDVKNKEVKECSISNEEGVEKSPIFPKHSESVSPTNTQFEEQENKDMVSSSISGYIRSLVFGDKIATQRDLETMEDAYIPNPRNCFITHNSPMTTIEEAPGASTSRSASDDTCKNVNDLENVTITQDFIHTQLGIPIAEGDADGNGAVEFICKEGRIPESNLCLEDGVSKTGTKAKKKSSCKRKVSPKHNVGRTINKTNTEKTMLTHMSRPRKKVVGVRSNLHKSASPEKKKSQNDKVQSQFNSPTRIRRNRSKHSRSPETSDKRASKLPSLNKRALPKRKPFVKSYMLNTVSSCGAVDSIKHSDRERCQSVDDSKPCGSNVHKTKRSKSEIAKKLRSKQHSQPSKKTASKLHSPKTLKNATDLRKTDLDNGSEGKKNEKAEEEIEHLKISGPQKSKVVKNATSSKKEDNVPEQLKAEKNNLSSSDFKVDLSSSTKTGKESNVTRRSSSHYPVSSNAQEVARNLKVVKERIKSRRTASKMLDNYDIEIKKEEVLGSVVSLVTYHRKKKIGLNHKSPKGKSNKKCNDRIKTVSPQEGLSLVEPCSDIAVNSVSKYSIEQGSKHSDLFANVYPGPPVESNTASESEHYTSMSGSYSLCTHYRDGTKHNADKVGHGCTPTPRILSLRPSVLDDVVKNLGSPGEQQRPQQPMLLGEHLEDRKHPTSTKLKSELWSSSASPFVTKPLNNATNTFEKQLSPQISAGQENSNTLQNYQDDFYTANDKFQPQQNSESLKNDSYASVTVLKDDEYPISKSKLPDELRLRIESDEVMDVVPNHNDSDMQLTCPLVPIEDHSTIGFVDIHSGSLPGLETLEKENKKQSILHSSIDIQYPTSCLNESEIKIDSTIQSELNIPRTETTIRNNSATPKATCLNRVNAERCAGLREEKGVANTNQIQANGNNSLIKSIARKLIPGKCQKEVADDKSGERFNTAGNTNSKIKVAESKKDIVSVPNYQRISFIKGKNLQCNTNRNTARNSKDTTVSKQACFGQAKISKTSKTLAESEKKNSLLLSVNRTTPVKRQELNVGINQSMTQAPATRSRMNKGSKVERYTDKDTISDFDLNPNDKHALQHKKKLRDKKPVSSDDTQNCSCQEKCEKQGKIPDTSTVDSFTFQVQNFSEKASLALSQPPDGNSAYVGASNNEKESDQKQPLPVQSFVSVNSKPRESAKHVFGSNATFALRSFDTAGPMNCGHVEPKVSNYRLTGDHFRKYRQRKDSDDD
ncbi:hypothetical protein EGW08_014513 [Elysia chlorotica]|uniref:Uncharacterized protein n=1 Tax=Elysia chlorotica TaxID=188477 RepID=A0A3S1BCX3_ELYCH|nr:hypothetical protein EGW08_014513 [Elysia chlorotica]